jgi:DNA-binding SARP family transcriptional activator
MIRLRVLGPPGLEGCDGGEVRRVIRRPKLLAVLAYLSASHPPGFRWRDELLALFWPGLEHDGAGRALRKALFLLRQELGREAIVSRGRSQVGVAQELVWCDAVAFRGAVARGGSAEAAGLYRGEFLPGFHVAGLRDFDEWLDATRRELRALSTEAHLDLAERARREGNAAETVRWRSERPDRARRGARSSRAQPQMGGAPETGGVIRG